jgi:hypothetical protein
MRAALRHLCQHGIEALKPQKVMTEAVQVGSYIAKPSKEAWRRPVVSKRVGNVLRKQALQDGLYGSFDVQTGLGWEPTWDLVLKSNQYQVSRYGGMQPSKKTSRERSREERARSLEDHLETRLEKMEDYYVEKEESRIKEKGFEAIYKKMAKGGTN